MCRGCGVCRGMETRLMTTCEHWKSHLAGIIVPILFKNHPQRNINGSIIIVPILFKNHAQRNINGSIVH